MSSPTSDVSTKRIEHRTKEMKTEIFNPKSNGLGFIRLYLALSVLVHHVLVVGGFETPLYLRSYLGGFAVDSFFTLSGFLITRSYDKNPNLKQFLTSRILRIYPGFWACLIVCCLIFYPIGIYLLTGSLDAVMFGQMVEYIRGNFTLQINDERLVWLFNGSFWTLKYEFICYLMIGLLGFLRLLKPIYLLGIFGFYWSFFICHTPQSMLDENWFIPVHLFAYFFAGAICYLWSSRLSWSWLMWGVSFAVVLLGYYFIPIRFLTMPLLIYFLLGMAKITPKNIERYGDYSYGLYLYHFPICELLSRLKVTQIEIFLPIVLIVSGLLAYLSWHYIEKPALKLKDFNHLKRSLHNGRRFLMRSVRLGKSPNVTGSRETYFDNRQ